MKNVANIKKIIIISAAVIFVLLFSFYAYKKIKNGNNESNKSAEEIQEYILNLNSYTANIEVTVNSNKNKNKYLINQEYKKGSYSRQTILKPENIEGIEIEYNNNTLTIKDSKLNISKVYNNYPYIADNVLWIDSFIEGYKNNKNAKCYEKNNEIIMEQTEENNKYLKTRKLYLEKGTGRPKKMEITGSNNELTIYISYNEISINK